jgi:predicted secreted protein
MTSPLTLLKSLINSSRGAGRAQDSRGKRFVAVIDCILNQNARDAGAARFPAMNFELLHLCHEHHVGILQMPCPEIAALGFKRTRQPGQTIRDALDTETGRRRCAQLAAEVVDRIEAYLAEGNQLMAILGGNPQSPGCAVHVSDAGVATNSGVFMKELQAELDRRNLKATFKGIRDHDPELLAQDITWFRELLAPTQEQEPHP